MPPLPLLLPSRVFERNLPDFLTLLAAHQPDEDGACALDFRNVEHWMPAAVVSACAMVNCWLDNVGKVHFVNHESCQAFRYLQRIDFFERVGLRLPEDFCRHENARDFLEIKEIKPDFARLNDPLSGHLAACLAHTENTADNVFRLTQFALGEIIANVQQHAGSAGFVSAQYIASKKWARIGIADCGVGILESFRQNQSPHYREGLTHAEALTLAMQPWISSKNHFRGQPYGETPNRGVGLSMIRQMISEAYGELFIASGDAFLHFNGQAPVESGKLGAEFPGTVLSIRLDHSQVADYQSLLSTAQQAMSLPSGDDDATFFQ